MRIGELAGLVGISTRAIRHYHRVGFAAAFYADFAPAQAAAIRRAVDLTRESRRADEDGQETTS